MNTNFNSSRISVADALDFIDSRKELFKKMPVVPTGLQPELGNGASAKALLFDIYGTLLISEAGDIGLTALDEDSGKNSFRLTGDRDSRELPVGEVKSLLKDIIYRHHEIIRSGTGGITYPEVDIVSVWEELFYEMNIDVSDINLVSRAALHFELLSNKVDLMPGVEPLFTYLKKQNLKLGIVSNAQFYTPLLMGYLNNSSLNEMGFQDEYMSWSYLEGCGKPDPLIFRKPVEALNRSGIQNHEILYIGNDMLNDISCAASHGLKTVLFAGDKRSLRMREDDPRVQCKADFVITDLMQIKQIIQDR